MTNDWRLLLVDTDEQHYHAIQQMLAISSSAELVWSSTFQSGLQISQSECFDVILVGLNPGDEQALSFTREATDSACGSPILLIDYTSNPENQAAAAAAGAQDYFCPADLNPVSLTRGIRYAIDLKKKELDLEKLNSELNRRIEQQKQDLYRSQQALVEHERLVAELKEAHQAARRLASEASQAVKDTMASATRLEAILNSLADAVLVYDQDDIVQMANSFAVAMFGFDPIRMGTTALLKKLSLYTKDGNLVKPEEMPAFRARQGELILNQPLTIANARGRVYSVLASALPLYIGKEFAGVVTVLNDITERDRLLEENRMQKELVEAERTRLETLISSTPEGMMMADKNCRVVLTNRTADTIFGQFIPPGFDLLDDANTFLLTPDGKRCATSDLPLVRTIREGKAFRDVELHIDQPDGTRRILLVNAAPISGPDEQISGGVATFRDITELRRLEAEKIENQTRKEVQRQLMLHREIERTQIARDLHDGPLQDLIATSYALVEAMQVDTKEERLLKMRWIQEALQKNIRDLRVFCNDLRPPVLAPFGLEKTIRSHIEVFKARHPDINVHLNLMQDGKSLPEEIRMTLFRVFQELINNIVRHSKASDVWIHMLLQPNNVILEVIDNGVGFTLPQNWIEIARQGHLGLIGMRERVESLGGTVVVETQPGVGTRIQVNVPASLT